MAASQRHQSFPSSRASRAKARSAKLKRGFVPRVIAGDKGAYIVTPKGDDPEVRLMVKGAADAIEAALLFMETGASGPDAAPGSVAVTDCETSLTHCFRLDFSSETISQA